MSHASVPRLRAVMPRVVVRSVVIAVALAAVVTVIGFRGAVALADEPDDAAVRLAQRYAPVVMVKAQEHPCDRDGEGFAPASVDIVLGNDQVVLRQVSGDGDPTLVIGPTAADLFDRSAAAYLDFPGNALDPGCVYEEDFARFSVGSPATVYAHVVRQHDRPDVVIVQYWLYWYYNDWNNTHESDWEGIQLWFDASSPAEALQVAPSSVGYAQHEGGERAEWGDARLRLEGDRPVVYSSAGSHASYYSSAVFLGRGPSEGFGCDDTTGPSRRVDPEVVVLPSSVSSADHPQAWLAFEGRWGERRGGPYDGPTGPAMKDRWTHPVAWHEGLRTASVVVPGGESWAATITEVFCDVVGWGSQQVMQAMLSPLRLVAALAVVALAAWWLLGRTAWDRVAVRPVRTRRRAGELLRAAPRRYATAPAVFAAIGLVYVPVALVTGAVVQLLRATPLLGSLVQLDTGRGGVSLFLALVVGGAANLVGYQVVSAIVAGVVARQDDHADVSLADVLDVLAQRWRALAGTIGRAALVVLPMVVFTPLVPVALFLVVRFQFLAAAVGIEDRRGWDALSRSSDLVRGRWWHTAIVTAVIQASLLAVSLLFGLILLVIASGLPLWLFSASVSVIVALIVPVAAIAQTFLYGDAVAARDTTDTRSADTAAGAVTS